MRFRWAPYVPVAQRREKAIKQLAKMQKKGKEISPVVIEGRTIAHRFWGKSWCDHMESFADFENRLPRGRTYVRNGSVCHLEIGEGTIAAKVSGSKVYTVTVEIYKLPPDRWGQVKKSCTGEIGSLLELLQGKFSESVMKRVCNPRDGLFPNPKEMKFKCSCPDWADMCKHVAAVLYGVGNRLDSKPEHLFLLRGVDPLELVAMADVRTVRVAGDKAISAIDDQTLEDIFGIELESTPPRKAKKIGREAAGGNDFPGTTHPVSRTKPVQVQGSPKEGIQPQGGASSVRSVTASKTKSITSSLFSGARIARFRKALGWTLARFGKECGVSAPTVANWEAKPGRLDLHYRTKDALEKLFKRANPTTPQSRAAPKPQSRGGATGR